MKTALIITLVCALFAFAFATEDDPDVIVLTQQNFDQVIEENKLILVEFYAPWCGHCKRLAPEYAQAATELKGVVPLAKVDADAEGNRALAQRFEIRGFPTLKLFRDGKPFEYNGDRTKEAIVSYLKKQSLPAVSIIENVDEATEFSQADKVVLIGFFQSEDSVEYTKFKEVAEQFRENFIFGAAIGKEAINKHFNLESIPTVVLFKKFDEGKNVLDSFDNLANFVQTNSIPLIDEVGPQNYRNYAESGLPLAYIFVDLTVEGQQEKYVEIVRPIAQKSKGKLNWVYIDWAKYAKHSERLGLSGKTVPAVAIENLEEGTHYAFDESTEITSENVATWVNTFLSGELQPTIKSEDVPADNSGPVKVVVAKTYDQIVLDSTKDVLVEFYAPWCGHCKSLAPIYEEIGALFSNTPSIVIAKIDATANDVNPKLGIRGFPTLKFFPANNKQTPIDYNGDRTKDDLIKFVKDNASIKIEGKDEL